MLKFSHPALALEENGAPPVHLRERLEKRVALVL